MGEKEAFGNIPLNSMLPLDMLAEVASETLRSDLTLRLKPGFKSKNANISVNKNCSQKRSATNSELLTLDQIRVLSDKMLIELFSEQSSDEIRRVFSYKCYLMPDNCSEIFSSFGNEMKARLQMKSHLLTHLAKLLAEANTSGIHCENQFLAEPLNVRKRRLQETSPKRRKKMKNLPKKTKSPLPKKSTDKKAGSLKSGKGVDQKINQVSKFSKNISSNQSITANIFATKAQTRLKKGHSKNSMKIEKENNCRELSPLRDFYLAMQKVGNSSMDVQDDLNIINRCVATLQEARIDSQVLKSDVRDYVTTTVLADTSSITINDLNMDTSLHLEFSNEKNSVKQIAIETSQQSSFQDIVNYPQHDHTYTSVNGKTFLTDSSEVARSFVRPPKEKRKFHHMCSGVAKQLIITTSPFPYVYEPILPHISEIKEVGNISKKSCDKCAGGNFTNGCHVKKNSVHNSISSPPFQNKPLRYRRVNKLIIPEELEPDTEDDENVPICLASNIVQDRLHEPKVVITEGAAIEQSSISTMLVDKNISDNPYFGERKLALKCIRALRMKKKDERGPLICQICNGKSFTAQATLMYHYRSHAGIKPFTCSVCDATFTRQHSLNYHMLIHNNKSRFACEECGRSFRHPSHYKEHLRRHTGETPFHCSDCNLRFKTRNTYKRHLKTRHGKILTARGIRVLSDEEFDKVRTMPRRRTSKQSLLNPVKSQWSDLTFSRIPDVKEEILNE